ncbi:MAG: DUF4405 domain-containing protein [Bacteroidales bacterium]|nr:DUF4405 domain-containing protein [Bacteroidales bacterium]
MMAIIGIGLLMKYELITGQERWIRYGRNVDITFWGMDRHEWGKIHLIIGLLLTGFLILHLILHWNSIIRFFRHYIVNRILRIAVVSLLVISGASLIIFPFIVNINVSELEYGYGHRQMNYSNSVSDTSIAHSQEKILQPERNRDLISEPQDTHTDVHYLRRIKRQEIKSEIEVKGYMTIRQVSEKYNVPANRIKEKLNIPLKTSDNERLGRMRQLYGFTMNDVRDAIVSERNPGKTLNALD